MHLLSSAGSGAGPALWCDALDLPGFGQSLPTEASCSVSGQAATVAALIEARGRGPVHLFGNSLGVPSVPGSPRPARSWSGPSPDRPGHAGPAGPPATARFPALCVPKFGGWLLSRVQKMSPQARVEASIATIYYDGSCVHPDRIGRGHRRDRAPGPARYGRPCWSAARGPSSPNTCAAAPPRCGATPPGQFARADHLWQATTGSWTPGWPAARRARSAGLASSCCPGPVTSPRWSAGSRGGRVPRVARRE